MGRLVYCRDCGYYRNENLETLCLGHPTEPMVLRFPDDFCSRGVKSNEASKNNNETMVGSCNVYDHEEGSNDN